MSEQKYKALTIGDELQMGDQERNRIGLEHQWKNVVLGIGAPISESDHALFQYRRPIREERGFPSGLPALPEPPEGCQWVYRGTDWHAPARTLYAVLYAGYDTEPDDDDWTVRENCEASGWTGCHYAEAVKQPEPAAFRIDGPGDYVTRLGEVVFIERDPYPVGEYKWQRRGSNIFFHQENGKIRISDDPDPEDIVSKAPAKEEVKDPNWHDADEQRKLHHKFVDQWFQREIWDEINKEWIACNHGWSIWDTSCIYRPKPEPVAKSQKELDLEAFRKWADSFGRYGGFDVWKAALAHARKGAA